MVWLIFNHVDAWGMTFIIAALSLAVRGALSAETLAIPFALSLGAWFAFAINDRFDAPFDAQEPDKARRNFFTRYLGERWQQTAPHTRAHDLILLIMFCVLAGIYGGFGWRGVLAGLAGFAAAWAYSAPPLRLKTRPFLDLFTHAAFVETFPYLAAIWLAGAPLLPFDVFAWIVLALASISAQLEQQARDYAVDSRFERNFTTVIGLQASHLLMQIASILLLTTGVIGVAAGLVPPFLAVGMACTIPMIAHRLIRPIGAPRSEKLIRFSMVVGALYIAAVVLFT